MGAQVPAAARARCTTADLVRPVRRVSAHERLRRCGPVTWAADGATAPLLADLVVGVVAIYLAAAAAWLIMPYPHPLIEAAMSDQFQPQRTRTKSQGPVHLALVEDVDCCHSGALSGRAWKLIILAALVVLLCVAVAAPLLWQAYVLL